MHSELHQFQEDINEALSSRNRIKNILYIACCHSCGKKIIWIDREYVYPNIVAEEVNPDWKQNNAETYSSAGE